MEKYLISRIKTKLFKSKRFQNLLKSNNIDSINNEIHFTPMGLTEIIEIIYNKFKIDFNKLSDDDLIELVISEIIILLSNDELGYAILTHEEHKAVHMNLNIISSDRIQGDLSKFFEKYSCKNNINKDSL
jgi:hypothetical protein